MKRFLPALFLFTLFAPEKIYTQNWLWAKDAPATSYDYCESTCTDLAGNVYVTGFFQGPTITFGSFTLNSKGNADVFVVKYDASGNVLWARSGGGNSLDEGQGISIDPAGNIYVTGFFQSPTANFGSLILTTSNLFLPTYFIVEYDPSGNALWANSITGANGVSISTDNSGNIYTVGYFNTGSVSFGSFTLTNVNPGMPDFFVAKYDPSGKVLWAKSAKGNETDVGLSIGCDAFGNAYVTGYFQSPTIAFDAFILVNSSTDTSEVFVAKYDPSGTVLWAKSAGGHNEDLGRSISTDMSGNSYVTGYFDSPAITFGGITLNNANPDSSDVFITKYDPSGNVLWSKSAGGNNVDVGLSVDADIFGNIYLVGGFNSSAITFGTTTLLPPPGSDDPMFIVKYDSNGNVLCTSDLASGGLPAGGNSSTVSADTLGNAYIGGGFTVNPFIVGSTALTLTGTQNIFVAKYTCCTPPIVTANASAETICQGSNITLNANGASNYSWNSVTALSCLICTNPTTSPSATTTYTVIGTKGGCSDTATITVTVNNNPSAVVSGNLIVYEGQSTILTASGGSAYAWNNGETTSTIFVSPETTTMYCVTVLDSNSCKDSICTTVEVRNPCDTAGTFYFPNAFSPNNDRENDLLEIYYGNKSCIKNLQLVIYNRWGEKVFETTDINFQWNGTYQGDTVNTQVLAYHLSVQFTDDRKINRKGNISLMR